MSNTFIWGRRGTRPAGLPIPDHCAVRWRVDVAFELFGAQLADFTQIESDFASAEAWTEANIGAPYHQLVDQINTDFDPFTLFTSIEGLIGEDIQTLLNDNGIQQFLLDPLLRLVGTFGGIFTS